MNRQEKIEQLLNERAWLIKGDTKAVPPPDGIISWQDELKKNSTELAKKIAGEEEPAEPPGDWQPNFPDRDQVLAIPVFQEYRIHYMSLAGWAYRNIDKHSNMVHQQIYEIARRTRISGAKFLRTFLMNGSCAKTEKYIMDALPWNMVIKDGRKVIDFDTHNNKYWGIVKTIEEACKYWRIQHMPTFWMERYNNDIFRSNNNVQKIFGFWTPEAADIKIDLMREYLLMQKEMRADTYLPFFEFINEPQCWGDHTKLGLVADHHLLLWDGIKDLTIIDHAVTCSGACEGAHANFVEKHWFDGRYYGSQEFASRKIKPEFHGVSTLQSLYDTGRFDKGLGSGWHVLSYNEDGCDDGSYQPLPWTQFRFANSAELYDMQYHGHTECERRNKHFYHTVFMMDCLRQDVNDHMIAKEEFDPAQIVHMDWDRAIQYRRVREDLE